MITQDPGAKYLVSKTPEPADSQVADKTTDLQVTERPVSFKPHLKSTLCVCFFFLAKNLNKHWVTSLSSFAPLSLHLSAISSQVVFNDFGLEGLEGDKNIPECFHAFFLFVVFFLFK